MKFSHIVRISLFSLFAIPFLSAPRAFGQAVNTARVHGRVQDAAGAVISDAQIKVTRIDSGSVRATVTGTEGEYAVPDLSVGEYRLEVSRTGFRDFVQSGIILQVGGNVQIDVTLQVGDVSQKVQVYANAEMVATNDTSISQVIDQRRVVDLPLDGRQATALVVLSGAANITTLASNDLVSSKNYANGGLNNTSTTISVGGGQVNGTNYLLDGADHVDSFSNVNLPFPFPDAQQEFSVQMSTQSARFGVHPGGTVNIVSKSGSNVFHGTAFEFIRNNAVNAQRAVLLGANPTPDTLKRNQFGGVIGGPIRKDKLFFFGGYQGTRNRSTPSPTSVVLPTAAARAGDFSTMMSATCLGTARQLRNPATGTNYANNFIDPTTFNQQAVALLQFIPVPTDPCGKYQFAVPTTGDEDQGIVRVDLDLNQRHTLFSRYFIADFNDPPIFDGKNVLPSIKAGQLSRTQALVVGDTYTITPTLVNSLHLAGTRLSINRTSAPDFINFNTLGVDIPNPVPNALVLSISNYFSVASGTATPGVFTRNGLQAADDLDWTHGRHQIAFGVNYIYNRLNELSNSFTNGQFAFTNANTRTRDALADFFIGLPNQFTQGNPEQENWQQHYFGFYANDTYKMRKNLTVIAGLRWEPYLPATDPKHKGSFLDPAAFAAGTVSQVFTNAPPGLFYCGDPGINCDFVNSHIPQFSPRVGLVWDPRGKGRETIRAGYGLFYDNAESFYFDRFADNSPYGAQLILSAPAGGFTNPYQGQTVPPFPTPFPTDASNAFFPVGAVFINVNPDLHPMYVQQWNLSVEKQFGANWLVSASYLGNKTTHLWIGYEANPAVYIPGSDCGTNPVHGTGTSVCSTTSNTAKRRVLSLIDPTQGAFFSSVTSAFDGANANYNAMLLSVNHRFSNHFTLNANYTFSHCISEGDFNGELTNSRQTQSPDPTFNERGNCGFDRRQIFNSALIAYSPNFENTLAHVFLSDWMFSSILSYTTGQALSPIIGSGDNSLSAIGKDRPNAVGDPFSGECPATAATNNQPVPIGTPGCWFNTSAFVANPTGTFGNAGRNILFGPGILTFNAGITRQFRITERQTLMVRFEAFNAINKLNLGNPNLSQSSAQFGQIRSALDPRVLQLALKYSF